MGKLAALAFVPLLGCAVENVSEETSAIEVQPSPTVERTVQSIVDEEVGPRVVSGQRQYVGLSILVIRDGKRHTLHYGEAVLGSAVKPTSNTLYAIGSVTKTFTATMLAVHQHRGYVSIYDTLDEHTGYALASPREKITLQRLATHYSGLVRNPPGGESGYREGTYRADMAKLMNTLDDCTTENPCNEPGTKEYSNYGFAVLAHVLCSTGPLTFLSVQAGLRTRVTSPLGMTDSSNKATLTEAGCVVGGCEYDDYGECTYAASCNGTFSARAAIGYLSDQTTRDSDEGSDDNIKAGSGVMWSTPRDMMTWLAYNMGLQADAPQEMQDILPALHGGAFPLGWGRMDTPDGRVYIGKSGDLPSFNSFVGWIEGTDDGVVVLANSAYPAKALGEDLLDAIAD